MHCPPFKSIPKDGEPLERMEESTHPQVHGVGHWRKGERAMSTLLRRSKPRWWWERIRDELFPKWGYSSSGRVNNIPGCNCRPRQRGGGRSWGWVAPCWGTDEGLGRVGAQEEEQRWGVSTVRLWAESGPQSFLKLTRQGLLLLPGETPPERPQEYFQDLRGQQTVGIFSEPSLPEGWDFGRERTPREVNIWLISVS